MSSRYENLEVLKNVWFTQTNGCFGIVKCRDIITNEIKYFAGMCNEQIVDEWTDICWIINNGQKINIEILEDLK